MRHRPRVHTGPSSRHPSTHDSPHATVQNRQSIVVGRSVLSGPDPLKRIGGCGNFPCSRGYHVRIARGRGLGARRMQAAGRPVFSTDGCRSRWGPVRFELRSPRCCVGTCGQGDQMKLVAPQSWEGLGRRALVKRCEGITCLLKVLVGCGRVPRGDVV